MTIVSSPCVVLVDHDPYTAGRLLSDIHASGFERATWVADLSELAQAVATSPPSIVVFNFHFGPQQSLEACRTIRTMAPGAPVLALAAVGPAIRHVRQWQNLTRHIDAVLEKPYARARFESTLKDLLRGHAAAQAMAGKTSRLESLLPEEAVSAALSERPDEVELFEATVLFTDIRRSSELITRMPPRDFFGLLNQTLSLQTQLIRNHEGSVIKFTGDGVLAVFRGMGRSYLAMRCALELAGSTSQQILPYGIGVAGGLILAGLVGDSQQAGQKRQYDVVGATVHLAARLCSMAETRQVVSTRTSFVSARLPNTLASPIGVVTIRGFEAGVDCVTLTPTPELTASPIGA